MVAAIVQGKGSIQTVSGLEKHLFDGNNALHIALPATHVFDPSAPHQTGLTKRLIYYY